MNDYAILVQARNRTLAADPTPEQQALYRFFQHALDNILFVTGKEVGIAAWYIAQPMAGEG